MTIKITQELVTPEMARDFLSRNPENRNLSKAYADSLASDMLSGRYNEDNPQGIAIDTENNLADGQHRLTAIVIAANSDAKFPGVKMFIARGVPPGTRYVMDFGRTRSVADMLTMAGHPYGMLAGAAAGIVLNWLSGDRLGAHSAHSKTEKNQFAVNHPDLFHYAGLGQVSREGARPSAMTATLYLATRSGDLLEEHARRFAIGVGEGAELSLRDPRLALRKWTYGHRRDKLSATMAATAHAWNAFVAGRELDTIVVRSGDDGEPSVPEIIGAPPRGAGLEALNRVVISPKVREIIDASRRALMDDNREEDRSFAQARA